MIKVVQICLEYAPSAGGSISTVKDIDEVFETTIVAFTSRINMSLSIKDPENVFRVPVLAGLFGAKYSLSLDYKSLRRAKNILLDADLVIIHELYRFHFQWACRIAKKNGIPFWIIPHGQLDPYLFTYRALQKKIWLKFVGDVSMKNANAIIYATERERKKASPLTSKCKNIVIHWPVKLIDTSQRNNLKLKLRKKLSISDDARVLFWIGRLHLSKRPLETIRIFGALNYHNSHLIMVGPDDSMTKNDLKDFCLAQNIENVHIIGPIYGEEKYNYFMASDAYISLSLKENFNYTAAEAMSCGLPVILSPGNDLAEEVRKHNCGWMLNTLEMQECIDVLTDFMSCPSSTIEQMGISGQIWARQMLSKDAFSFSLQEQIKK